MTNYNDGKWHGWNGGDCPVHPDTEVEVSFVSGRKSVGRAGKFSWRHWADGVDIVTFRVIKEHKEPQEIWVWTTGTGHPAAYRDKETCVRDAEKYDLKHTVRKYREVEE